MPKSRTSIKSSFAKRRVPLRRYGIPEEVAHITLSCCLPAASYLNGAVIPVDGGLEHQERLGTRIMIRRDLMRWPIPFLYALLKPCQI